MRDASGELRFRERGFEDLRAFGQCGGHRGGLDVAGRAHRKPGRSRPRFRARWKPATSITRPARCCAARHSKWTWSTPPGAFLPPRRPRWAWLCTERRRSREAAAGAWGRRPFTDAAPSALPNDYPAPLVQPASSGLAWRRPYSTARFTIVAYANHTDRGPLVGIYRSREDENADENASRRLFQPGFGHTSSLRERGARSPVSFLSFRIAT